VLELPISAPFTDREASVDTREQTDAPFAHLSDEELRATASNPNTPARLLPALRAELRSRRGGTSGDHQPWQQTHATTVQFPTTMQVVVTDIHMSFSSMVVFMVKWSLASIPAFIILFVLALVCILVINVLGVQW
jgi:hypothetical protein